MSYVNSVLEPNERVLFTGHLHWIIYSHAFVCLVPAFAAFASAPFAPTDVVPGFVAVGGFFLAIAAMAAFAAWFDQWVTEIAVTNRRIIYKHGFIRRDTAEMNLDKVESVIVTQSVLARLLDFGSIHVRGTGVGMEHLHKIAAPLQLRSCITTHQ